MGFLDFFFGNSSSCEVADAVWVTRKARAVGLVKAIQEAMANQMPVLIVCHFSKDIEELAGVLEISKTAFTRRALWNLPEFSEFLNDSNRSVQVCLVRDLPSIDIPLETDCGKLLILGYQRHPLREEDDRIVTFAESLKIECKLRFMHSFDDVIFKRFVDDSVRTVLEQMGFTDEDCIDSSMVARRLHAAQRSIAKQANGNVIGDSAEDWIRVNIQDNS